MNTSFKVIGLAVSFSPTTKAMVAEASRLVKWFQSDLVLIHVGKKDYDKERNEAIFDLITQGTILSDGQLYLQINNILQS